MDLVVGVVCCCALRSLVASFGCSAVSEAMKDREGREASNSGLRIGMEAAMMPTFISRLWHESTWLAQSYRT